MSLSTTLIRFFGHSVGNFRLWFLLFVFSVMSVVDIPTAPIYDYSQLRIICYLIGVGAFKATLISVLYHILTRHRYSRPVGYILIVSYILISLLNAVCYSLYGFGISRRLILIIAQTSCSEITEFLPGLTSNIHSTLSSIRTWLVCAILLFLLYAVRFIPAKIYYFSVALLTIGGLIILTIFSLTYTFGRTANFLSLRIPKYIAEVYRSEKAIRDITSDMREFPYKDTLSSRFLASDVILVIGESASRAHHSLYGYPLPTTPHLDSICDSLYIFTDAIGSSCSTASNMERILTFKPDDLTDGDWYKFPTMIDLFRNAGYKVFWLSNQERTGLMSNASGAIAANADVVKYTGADNSEDMLAMRHDEVLLPEISKALDDKFPHKLIIVHLMGSHTKYRNRYPGSLSTFTAEDILHFRKSPWITKGKAQTIAEYDNSIHYTDYILSQIIEKIRLNISPTLFLYVSDHGENVYDDRDFIGREEKNVEVPYFIYTNTSYKTNNPDIHPRIRAAIAKPISTANIIHQLITLTGTTYHLYDPTIDPLSTSFCPHTRNVDEHPWLYDKQ